jgi:hypothetical protein
MATQQILNAIQEWSTQDLLTLEEMKVQLRIPDTDTSKDDALMFIIDSASAQIAAMVNRVFGYAKVHETFYDITGSQRLYFSRWPVKKSEIESMTLEGADVLPATDWVIEEKTGTLYAPPSLGRAGWGGDLDVVYYGGYKLPEEAPDDLKRAVSVAARDDYYQYLKGGALSGVRMISHKSARIQYYPQGGQTDTRGGGQATAGPTWNAINAVLRPYFRHWV